MTASVPLASFSLLVGAALATALLAALPAGDAVIKDRTNFIPQHKNQVLPGKVVGVLAGDAQPVFKAEGRHGPPDALGFSVDGCSYLWVYVPVAAGATIDSLDVLVGPRGEQTKRFDRLAPASPRTVQRWGVTEPFALVEAEVNGGLGSPPDDSFVATSLKRLDGTAQYPLKVATVVADLRREYRTFLTAQDAQIDAGMQEVRKKVLGERKATGPREREELLYVTWMRAAEQLRVHFLTRVTDGAYSYASGVPPKDRDKPPPPNAAGIRYGTQFGVELGMGYEVDKTGRVVGRLRLPQVTFHKELPPPPGAPPGPRPGE